MALILPVSVTLKVVLLAPILIECYRLFFELFEKNVVLGRIWFECTWTALFGAMELGRFYSVLTPEPLTYAFVF